MQKKISLEEYRSRFLREEEQASISARGKVRMSQGTKADLLEFIDNTSGLFKKSSSVLMETLRQDPKFEGIIEKQRKGEAVLKNIVDGLFIQGNKEATLEQIEFLLDHARNNCYVGSHWTTELYDGFGDIEVNALI